MSRSPKPTPEGIVAELYTLLQEIAADGIITDEEASELHEWLLHNRNAGIPKFDFLRQLLDHFLADGKITDAERKAIHSALEKVLPPELRAEARMARQARQMVEKAEVQSKREAENLRRPIHRADFMVVGVRHEGRATLVEEYLRAGEFLHLVREPSNAYDSNAILVRLMSGHDIGYVPRELAVDMAPLLDAGSRYTVTCKKILRGRDVPVPVVYALMYRGDQQIPNTFKPSDAPSRTLPRPSGTTATSAKGCGSGCGGCLALIAMLIVAFALMASR